MSTDVTTDRPMRADAARNRDRVPAAASELFAEVGLRAGIEDIARRAGVGVGTVCRSSGQGGARRGGRERPVAEPARRRGGRSGGARSRSGLRAVRLCHRRVSGQAPGTGGGDASEINLPIRDQVRQDLHAAISQLVARAQAVGTLRTDIGPADVAMLLSVSPTRPPWPAMSTRGCGTASCGSCWMVFAPSTRHRCRAGPSTSPDWRRRGRGGGDEPFGPPFGSSARRSSLAAVVDQSGSRSSRPPRPVPR